MGKSKKSEKKSKKKHKKSDKQKHKKSKKSRKELKEPSTLLDKVEKSVERTKDPPPKVEVKEDEKQDFAIPLDLMNSKSHAPETAEEYQKRQSHIRRVTDPVTGRVRLIKGDGEVLEEIVTKTRHQEINKTATKADGVYFADKTVGSHKKTSRNKR